MALADSNKRLDTDVRHFIYHTFANTSVPPTALAVARRFQITVVEAEAAFERLAAAHHIALAPGTTLIWMAHPFSGLPTHFEVRAGDRKFWGN